MRNLSITGKRNAKMYNIFISQEKGKEQSQNVSKTCY